MGGTMFRSSMFNCSKPKIRCLSFITYKWPRLSLFNVRQNDVQVCTMNNSVNIGKTFYVWCPFVQSQKVGVRVRSSLLVIDLTFLIFSLDCTISCGHKCTLAAKASTQCLSSPLLILKTLCKDALYVKEEL